MLLHKRPIGTIGFMGGLPAVLTDFCWSWGQLVAYSMEYMLQPGETIHLAKSSISLHDAARHQLVDQMLGDWLLMLDADHSPEPDLAARLVRWMLAEDWDVVTALYCQKWPPYMPV